MSWQVLINFSDGVGDRDITHLVLTRTMRRDRKLYGQDFKCTQSTCRFQIKRDVDTVILNKLLTTSTDDVVVTVEKDGAGYFKGVIRQNFDVRVVCKQDPINIEVIDYSEILKKKIKDTFCWAGYKVLTAADTDHSIVYQLLDKAGLDPTAVIAADVDKTIDYFVNIGLESDDTYFSVLQKLLFEFGYVFYFDGDGNFCTYNFLPVSLSASFDFTSGVAGTMKSELRIKRQPEKYEAAEIQWWLHEVMEAATIFNDTTGSDSSHMCQIPLASGEYYPSGSESAPVYSEYSIKDREIIYCDSALLSMAADGGIEVTEFTNYYRRVLMTIYNPGPAGTITQLKISGRAVVKGDLHKTRRYTIADTEKMRTYKSEYITAEADAQKLAVGLAEYDRYSVFEYKTASRSAVALGAIAMVQESGNLGISNSCRIVAITDYEEEQIHEYTLEGVDAYTALTTSSEFVHTQPAPPQSGEINLITSGVFSSVVHGFDAGGGTTIPSKVTITRCHGAYRANVLEWDIQTYLTNLLRYDVDVSDDGSTWYELNSVASLSSWHGSVDIHTEWPIPYLVHANLPPAGTQTAPEVYTLYYQVRRVTKDEVFGDWSDTASATFSLIETQSIPADTIDVNQLRAGTLNAMIANVCQFITIDAEGGFQGQTYTGTPINGDRRCFLVEDELRIEQYNGTAWITVLRVGGTSAGDFYPYFQGRGLIHQNANISEFAVGDQAPEGSYHFGFENTYVDTLRGQDIWSKSGALEFSTLSARFGSYCLAAASGSTAFISQSQAFGCKLDANFGITAWLNNIMQPAEDVELARLENDRIDPTILLGSATNESAIFDTATCQMNESTAVILRRLTANSGEIICKQVSKSTVTELGSSAFSGAFGNAVTLTRVNNSTVLLWEAGSGAGSVRLAIWNGSGFDLTGYTAVPTGGTTNQNACQLNDSTILICATLGAPAYTGAIYAIRIEGTTITIGDGYAPPSYTGGNQMFSRIDDTHALYYYYQGTYRIGVLIIHDDLSLTVGGSAPSGNVPECLTTTSAIVGGLGWLYALNIAAESCTVTGSTAFGTNHEICGIKRTSNSTCLILSISSQSTYLTLCTLSNSTITIGTVQNISLNVSNFKAYGSLLQSALLLVNTTDTDTNASSRIVWVNDINFNLRIMNGSLQFQMTVPPMSETLTQAVASASGIQHLVSFNFNSATGLMWVTHDGGSAYFSVSSKYMTSDTLLLKLWAIQNAGVNNRWDDLLVTPLYLLTPAAVSAHYVSGNPWSYDIDPTKDVVIAPAASGKIILTASTIFKADVAISGSLWISNAPLPILIPDPATGYFAQKLSGWTNDSFSGGMELDFSSVVSVGTKAVLVPIVFRNDGRYTYYARKYGDSNISNTPQASAEIGALISINQNGEWIGYRVKIFLSDDYKAQIAAAAGVGGTYIECRVGYPIEEFH